MPQVVLEKAVKAILPSAIPTNLEKIDQYAVGKVLVYSKKPRKLLPTRKHHLDFTGWSLQHLLAEGESIDIVTARSYLFDTGTEKASKTLDVKVGADLDISSAIASLAHAAPSLKFNAGDHSTLSITSDFGKVTHVSTDLISSVLKKQFRLNLEHPIVKTAVEHGGTMFVINSIYEGDHCTVKATLGKDIAEGTTDGAKVGAVGKADVSESVDDKHKSTTVISRDQPTPLAYLLMKLSIDSKGVTNTNLNKRISKTLEVSFPYATPLSEIPNAKVDKPASPSGGAKNEPDAPPPASDKDKPKEEGKKKVEEDPVVAVTTKPLGSEPPPAAAGSAGMAAEMPDEHYLYSLKDFQPFESSTYLGILEETQGWVNPFAANAKLQAAFFKYTKLPGTYEKLNDLSAYFLEVGNSMRAKKTPPTNVLKDLDPIMAALSTEEDTRLNEITSVVVIAEAGDEFPKHILQKIFELSTKKKDVLKDVILQTPYGSSAHTYTDSKPFKDSTLKPIMQRMGFSLVGPNKSLTHTRKETDEDEDIMVSTLILLLCTDKPKKK